MVDKNKTKSAMLLELESIKGLLLEEDMIPILQEVIEQPPILQSVNAQTSIEQNTTETSAQVARRIYSEQQDFFQSESTTSSADSASQLLDTLSNLEKATSELTKTDEEIHQQKSAHHSTISPASPSIRPNLAKAAGENPFLPEHIRARLHGNNPPPLFEIQTAKKIANTSRPTTQLGNTQYTHASHRKIFSSQQELIDDVMDTMLPDIEKELRQRLEGMTREMLEKLRQNKV